MCLSVGTGDGTDLLGFRGDRFSQDSGSVLKSGHL